MSRWRYIHLQTCVLFLLVGAYKMAPTALLAAERQEDIFRDISNEIIRGIDLTGRPAVQVGKLGRSLRYFQRVYSQSSGEKLRIAIWPYDENELPIPKEIAEEYNDRLLAQLQRLAGGRYNFIARNTLKVLIKDMDSLGTLDASGGNPINALMEKAGDIHFLISGKIRRERAQIVLTYNVISFRECIF